MNNYILTATHNSSVFLKQQLVTKKFTKYERKLLEEYRLQTTNIELDYDGKFQRRAGRRSR